MRVTTMIANRFVQGAFTLVFSAETTRARVSGRLLTRHTKGLPRHMDANE